MITRLVCTCRVALQCGTVCWLMVLVILKEERIVEKSEQRRTNKFHGPENGLNIYNELTRAQTSHRGH